MINGIAFILNSLPLRGGYFSPHLCALSPEVLQTWLFVCLFGVCVYRGRERLYFVISLKWFLFPLSLLSVLCSFNNRRLPLCESMNN